MAPKKELAKSGDLTFTSQRQADVVRNAADKLTPKTLASHHARYDRCPNTLMLAVSIVSDR
jgi:hypothetical protein